MEKNNNKKQRCIDYSKSNNFHLLEKHTFKFYIVLMGDMLYEGEVIDGNRFKAKFWDADHVDAT